MCDLHIKKTKYLRNISKTKQGNQKLKEKCSFKRDKLDFRVQFSFKTLYINKEVSHVSVRLCLKLFIKLVKIH